MGYKKAPPEMVTTMASSGVLAMRRSKNLISLLGPMRSIDVDCIEHENQVFIGPILLRLDWCSTCTRLHFHIILTTSSLHDPCKIITE